MLASLANHVALCKVGNLSRTDCSDRPQVSFVYLFFCTINYNILTYGDTKKTALETRLFGVICFEM